MRNQGPMRILVSTLCLEKAGSHVLALSLASAMAAQGHHVFLYNQGEQLVDAGMVEQYLSPRVQVVAMDRFPLINKICWKINALVKKLGVNWSFHEWCKTLLLFYTIWHHRIDIVHGHEVLVEKSRLVKLRQWSSVPIAVTDHGGYSMLIKMGDWSFVPYANMGQSIVAVSEYSARLLRGEVAEENPSELRQLGAHILATDYQAEFNSLNASRTNTRLPLTTPITTIYNGVASTAGTLPTQAIDRSTFSIQNESLVFGMIGRGTEQKGWRYAYAAYQHLKQLLPDQPFTLLCMGDGPVIQELRQQTSADQSDIVFLGNVDNPHQYMPLCDVGLMPSCFSEGLPLSIIEFFEHQVPVIASSLGGIPELIEPIDLAPGGLLVPIEPNGTPNMKALVHAMHAYAINKDLRDEHARNSARIRARFNMEQCATAYEKLFRELTS
ncbi:glycosyltransferase [Hymenobacter oligotrophus]|uniref:Glycosyltransferase n=1 Tax=Hymenobacter oligotrophus TaxID=2319843 RepID=A0A3B7R7H7_9BACT|nr:glycosyltransferase family 4 protein [Hymenobacter oligotrophus]AYA37191.1 glycosyltransferase [Hymenobacter oligotrophus]